MESRSERNKVLIKDRKLSLTHCFPREIKTGNRNRRCFHCACVVVSQSLTSLRGSREETTKPPMTNKDKPPGKRIKDKVTRETMKCHGNMQVYS